MFIIAAYEEDRLLGYHIPGDSRLVGKGVIEHRRINNQKYTYSIIRAANKRITVEWTAFPERNYKIIKVEEII